MSTFTVQTTTGKKLTAVAANIAYVIEVSDSESTLVFADGVSVGVVASHRSVKGYIKKALGSSAPDAE